jgi:GT2 family glycosyltransferase
VRSPDPHPPPPGAGRAIRGAREAPFITVVVPTFNRPKALAQCLAALAAQDHPRARYELVVVDDGSAPGHADAVRRVVEAHGGRLLRQENRGPAAARNHGARTAEGEFVAFIDDDCVPDRTWLSRLARACVAERPTALGGRTVCGLAGDACADATQLLVDYLSRYYAGTPAAFFTSNNLLLPRRELLAIGGFDETMRLVGGEDRELCARWTHRGFGLAAVEDAVVHHRHALTLGAFWRQHFDYGRGSWRYHLRRARRTGARLRLAPPTFYRGLLGYPLRRARGLKSVALIALAQVATASGFCAAATWDLASGEGRGLRDPGRLTRTDSA